jgi:hypothetical protein
MKYAAEELKTLREWVGHYPLSLIAKKLNRTAIGIEVKLTRLGITNTKNESGCLTAGELARIIGVDRNTVIGWIKRHGLKSRNQITRHKKVYTFIQTEEFWRWAFANKERVDFSKISRNSLPPEPEWLACERKNLSPKPTNYKKWTIQEEKSLLDLYNSGRQIQYIAREMGRSVSSIQKKICRLKK